MGAGSKLGFPGCSQIKQIFGVGLAKASGPYFFSAAVIRASNGSPDEDRHEMLRCSPLETTRTISRSAVANEDLQLNSDLAFAGSGRCRGNLHVAAGHRSNCQRCTMCNDGRDPRRTEQRTASINLKSPS